MVVGSLAASPGFADGLYLQESLVPTYYKADPTPVDPTVPLSPASGLGYDTKTTVGYILFNRLFLGANLNFKNTPLNQDALTGAGAQKAISSSTKYLEFGPSLGYVHGGFHGILTYIMAGNRTYSEKQTKADGTVSSDMQTADAIGSGIQIDVGYSFQLSPRLALGPSLVYRSVSYKTQSLTDNLSPANSTNGVTFTTNPVDANITPMITLSFGF
ncbi:hypothetical protein WDW37_02015 [Bdellovibrionota bacterium FG-1]